MTDWGVADDIDQGLAANFDDSLSGLGVELGTSSYNMSEALMALPNVTPAFKEEVDLTSNSSECCQHQNSISNDNHVDIPNVTSNSICFGDRSTNLNSVVPILDSFQEYSPTLVNQDRFQFVLGAATSIATKLHEETLTYLNQGQSYEIKFKKLGDLSAFRGKILKSIVRVIFHDRKLQYVADEHLDQWKRMRPGERIIDIDVPLSYGVFDVNSDSSSLNELEFSWDPTNETGVFVKLNCISTEFTPKKHGGEKGVPFRILIETFSQDNGSLLHKASCQVKVFKPKGADRKHKTDREKMEKRSELEQKKYQPSYDCTVFTDSMLDNMYTSLSNSPAALTRTDTTCYSPATSLRSSTPQSSVDESSNNKFYEPCTNQKDSPPNINLNADANAQQTAQWLHLNRFSNFSRVFANFSGADLLRLTREDFIQICGLADGIRLHNALHSIAIKPRLTIYVCVQSEQVYHALYLENLDCSEVVSKLAPLLGIQCDKVLDVYIQGPNGIHILITDEVIHNINPESMFIVDLIKDQNSDLARILLKTT